jgi:hypothetical protein
MSDLISHPELYDGRRVRVVGFCRLEFEGDSLYAQSADYFHQVYKHGMWLDLDAEARRADLDLSDRYVVVEATFDAKRQGHMGLWSGMLTAVTRIEPTP